jgi:hypothetical protein
MEDLEYTAQRFEDYYMNMMQIRATIVDSNVMITEGARAVGKTEGIMGPRIIRVANDMPGELGFLAHKTYTALLTNVWPNIAAYFARPVLDGRRSMLEYGVDYVVGETKIPSHFKKPRYPISYPKHSILFRNGFHLQMISSDQPESVAGRSGVHAFIEEMKHQKGEKLKTRLFPSLRGSSASIRQSQYYQGITGVSDTARVDLGEDNWFEEYEHNVNLDLIEDIVSVSLDVNNAQYNIFKIEQRFREEKNPVILERLRLEQEKYKRRLMLWAPRLAEERLNASYYIRASSFVNKDILGPKFFKTQLDALDTDEFLTAICAVRRKACVDRFFANYVPKIHQYSDSYKQQLIFAIDLKDKFRLTAWYLKYYNPNDEIIIGYDPGSFSSIVVAQEKPGKNELRVLKNFTCYAPREQPELAKEIFEFFGPDAKNKRIRLYHDRAGNKRKEEYEQITTDARILKRELESFGFQVELQNEGQSTIYHWMQFKLLLLLFGGKTNSLPKIIIDENECKDLCSSIMLSPRKKNIDGRIELDKTSEVKVPLKLQAGLTTQLPSAFIYMLFGLYGDRLPSEFSNIPYDLPDNMTI